MTRLIATLAALATALVLAVPALGYGGPNPPQKATDACGANIEKQTAKGVSAGGGKKQGIPAPTNCDHFFQNQGDIGNGPPGP